MADITIVHGVYKPTNITGGHHPGRCVFFPSIHGEAPVAKRLHLRLFASNGPGLTARALHGRHGALVDPAELREAGDQATPGVLQGPGRQWGRHGVCCIQIYGISKYIYICICIYIYVYIYICICTNMYMYI